MNDTKHHRPKALETPTIFHVLPLFGGSLDFNYLLVSISHAIRKDCEHSYCCTHIKWCARARSNQIHMGEFEIHKSAFL